MLENGAIDRLKRHPGATTIAGLLLSLVLVASLALDVAAQGEQPTATPDPHSPRPDIVVFMLDDIPKLDGRILRRMPNIKNLFLDRGIDFSDPVAMQAYVAGLPIGALLFVMAAWLLATLAGGLLACIIARDRPLVYSAIVGGLVLLGTAMNLLSIPHPLWFSVTSVLAIVATIFITARLGSAFAVTPGGN